MSGTLSARPCVSRSFTEWDVPNRTRHDALGRENARGGAEGCPSAVRSLPAVTAQWGSACCERPLRACVPPVFRNRAVRSSRIGRAAPVVNTVRGFPGAPRRVPGGTSCSRSWPSFRPVGCGPVSGTSRAGRRRRCRYRRFSASLSSGRIWSSSETRGAGPSDFSASREPPLFHRTDAWPATSASSTTCPLRTAWSGGERRVQVFLPQAGHGSGSAISFKRLIVVRNSARRVLISAEGAVADEGRGHAGEGQEVSGLAFVAAGEPTAADRPGHGPLTHPDDRWTRTGTLLLHTGRLPACAGGVPPELFVPPRDHEGRGKGQKRELPSSERSRETGNGSMPMYCSRHGAPGVCVQPRAAIMSSAMRALDAGFCPVNRLPSRTVCRW